MNKILIIAIGIISLGVTSCTKADEGKQPKTEKVKFRNAAKPKLLYHGNMETSDSAVISSPVLESLKNNHLEVSSTKTIGAAFDAYKYSTKKTWRETSTEKGPYYIDFSCWLDVSPVSRVAFRDGVVKRGLDIKFAIQDGGETYISMITRNDIKSDGMSYTTIVDPPDIKKIVTAIYENREITF